MSDEERARTAPVQGSEPIPWAVHVAAWEGYDRKWRCGQSAERIAARGGFHVNELDEFLPGWRNETGRALFTQEELAAALRAERERCENICADIMRKHRADRQHAENDPDMREEFWMAKSAEDSAKDCVLAIRALGEEG